MQCSKKTHAKCFFASFNSSYLEKNNIKKMKILFIIPYIPFPLNSGGNQAFFNMVDYLRHKMDVSILLQVQYASEAYDISKLKEIWDNVTFFVFTKKDDKQPKVHHPFYYKWLIKTKQSIERKIRRQIIPENIVFTPDFIRQESTLSTSIFKELDVCHRSCYIRL